MRQIPPRSTLFPYTTLFRSAEGIAGKNDLFPRYLVRGAIAYVPRSRPTVAEAIELIHAAGGVAVWAHPFWDLDDPRSEEHTSELQSRRDLVCRLLLEKKKSD